MAKIIYDRRCGNTTRQVDEWIQELFTKGAVSVIDHAHNDTNSANRHAERVLFRRLATEHELRLDHNSPLFWAEEGKILTLKF